LKVTGRLSPVFSAPHPPAEMSAVPPMASSATFCGFFYVASVIFLFPVQRFLIVPADFFKLLDPSPQVFSGVEDVPLLPNPKYLSNGPPMNSCFFKRNFLFFLSWVFPFLRDPSQIKIGPPSEATSHPKCCQQVLNCPQNSFSNLARHNERASVLFLLSLLFRISLFIPPFFLFFLEICTIIPWLF